MPRRRHDADRGRLEVVAAITDWRARVAAATQARDRDAAALTRYADAVRTLLAQYGQLRQDLALFTVRVEDPLATVTPYDGFTYMSLAADARQQVRDDLNALTVPTDVRTAHAGVVAVVDRGVTGVRRRRTSACRPTCGC